MTEVKPVKIATFSGHKAPIYSICHGFTEHHILSAGGDGWVVKWDLRSLGKGKLIARAPNQLFSVTADPNKEYIVAGSLSGDIHLFKPGKPETERIINWHKKAVYHLAFFDKFLISCGGDGVVSKWSFPEMNLVESLQLSKQSIRSFTFNPSTNTAAIGSSDNNISFVNLMTFNLAHQIRNAHNNSIFCLLFAAKTNLLISGARDAQISVWKADDDYKLMQTVPAHLFSVNDLVESPDQKYFASASRDKTIKIWDINTFKLLKVIDLPKFDGHAFSVNKLLWSNFENYLISASDDRTMLVWHIEENIPK